MRTAGSRHRLSLPWSHLAGVPTVVTAVGLIVSFQFNQFVVDPDDQTDGYPLSDEVSPFVSTGKLAHQRQDRALAATPRYAENGMDAVYSFTDFGNLSSVGCDVSVSNAPS
jgi:hypothetical protein